MANIVLTAKDGPNITLVTKTGPTLVLKGSTNPTLVLSGGLTGAAGPAGVSTDATTTAKGIVKLAGDLAGTATAPTVPALANKAAIAGQVFTGAISATNLSGTNTGDETTATIKTKLSITTLSGSNTGDQTNVTGTAANVTGVVAIANGGTAATTTQGAINATNPHTTLGDISYRDTANVSRLAGNTTATKQFLTQTGTGTVSAAPAWGAIAAGDVPTLNQSTTGSAATLTTARTIGTLTGDVTSAGSTFNGSANNTNATTVTKINGTSLAALSTGILKNTTTTGVPSIAVAADFPTLNQNTTGTAASITGSITESQVTNLTTDLAAKLSNITGLITAGSNVTVTGSGTSGSPYSITSTAAGGGGGTVTSASVVSANGFAGTVATATTTPAITISTTATGVLKGNGTAISAATAETDYTTPTGTGALTNKTISGASNTLSNIPESAVTNLTTDLAAKVAKDVLVYNVKDHGVVGDGTTDDTTAIQAAITAVHTAGGGIVFFPLGTYKITADLTLYGSITIRGAGMEVSTIKQATLNSNGLRGDGLSSVIIQDIAIIGNGSGTTAGTGTGKGIYLTYGSNGNNPFHNFTNVMVRNWGSDGVYIQTAIVSNFNKVYSAYNGGHGFNWPEGGTSCTFNGCWARGNAQAGYRFFTSVYQSLNGCAADSNGIGYLVDSAQSISFTGTGAESQLKKDATYNGYAWKITNSSVITLDGVWVTNNISDAIWITSGSNGISIRAADNSPNVSTPPTSFIKTDTGTVATIYELHNTTANSLAAGTYTIINDGGNGLSAKKYNATGTSGTISLYADPDANEYNLGVTATGTLGLFGAGGNTLHLNMFDGDFKTNGTVRLSNAGVLQSVRYQKRVLALSANSATPAVNTDSYDVVHITAQTATITGFTMTGTPVDGDQLRVSITGTAAVPITWGTSFESSTATLPTTTVTTARLDVGFFWNTETSKWRCVAVA